MSEGTYETAHKRHEAALTEALTHFRSLLASVHSKSWKPYGTSSSASSTAPPSVKNGAMANVSSSMSAAAGKAVAQAVAQAVSSTGSSPALGSALFGKPKAQIGQLEPSSVRVHRRSSKTVSIIRAIAEVPISNAEYLDINTFKAALQTPEVWSQWNQLIERAQLLEQVDPATRITKTDYVLGWPASPRDTVTISRTFQDAVTVIDVATSLPRSADEPAYLRPSPPFVRSQNHLLAWCIQIPTTSLQQPFSGSAFDRNQTENVMARITMFWQWDLKGTVVSSHHTQVANILSNFVSFVREKGDTLPSVMSYGKSLELVAKAYDPGQETLSTDYTIVAEDDFDHRGDTDPKGMDELASQRERKRLERSIEFALPAGQGWDVAVIVRGQGDDVNTDWQSSVENSSTDFSKPSHIGSGHLVLRLSHARLLRADELVSVKVKIQRLAGGRSVRINNKSAKVVDVEVKNPAALSRQILEAPADDTTQQTSSTIQSVPTAPSLTTLPSKARANAISIAIGSLVSRSYVYFTSLLQEPEAKWRHISDTKGVTVTQLNSLDPTLAIYKAEATFVGVGVWDIYCAIATASARLSWDKTVEDVHLLDHVNELSSLWYFKTKAAWPVSARDSVLLRTTYRSPSSVHVFSFSADDTNLFSAIPAVESAVIRTQTDVYGWAIEALSPTTTQITLIEQSNPKGWSNKSWIPQQMISSVSGVGDFAIKHGGPPVLTRLLGGKLLSTAYEHERSLLKLEYVAAPRSSAPDTRTLALSEETTTTDADSIISAAPGSIECELRCDTHTWASSLDIVIDPPPSKVSCLSRHRLSSGAGCWITIEHENSAVMSDRVLVVVRKGALGREKGSVVVNGCKAHVDIEDMPDDEVKLLATRKRVKASPIPLDQYPAITPSAWRGTPTLSALGTPALGSTNNPLETLDSSERASMSDAPRKPPLSYALEALAWLQALHAEQMADMTLQPVGWSLVTEKPAAVRKKLLSHISSTLPVFRADKIVQGVTAEQMCSIVSLPGYRAAWDDRVESVQLLSSHGHGCTTSLMTTKSAFLTFRGRAFYHATVNAHFKLPAPSAGSSTSTVYLCATASFQPSAGQTDELNPQRLPNGQTLLDGWILETLDPYTSNDYAIPSTRCSYFSAVDYSGSVPAAFNSMLNANLARVIDAVERSVKTRGAAPRLYQPGTSLQIEGPLSSGVSDECKWVMTTDPAKSVAANEDADSVSGFYAVSLVIPKHSMTLGSVPPEQERASAVGLPKSSSNYTLSSISAISKGHTLRKPASSAELRSRPSIPALKTAPNPQSIAARPKTESDGLNSPVDDLVVGEIIVDSRRYPAGYNIQHHAHFGDGQILLGGTDHNYATSALPVQLRIHELPLSTVVAASVGAPHRYRDHLIRIMLPTGAIEHPVRDPLMEDEPAARPHWYRRLLSEGITLTLNIAPTEGGAADTAMTASYDGTTLGIISEQASRRLLDIREEQNWLSSSARLSRVPIRTGDATSTVALPAGLIQPLAARSEDTSAAKGTASRSASQEKHSRAQSGLATPIDGQIDPSEGKRPIDTLARTSAANQDDISATTGVLGGFPLAKMTTAVASFDASMQTKAAVSLTMLILVAVTSFLLGSLMRSMLSPADFIFVSHSSSLDDAVIRALEAKGQGWRIAKRLLELKIPGLHYDFMISIARHPT
ncbi:uncharacterized protein L969DRAFT_73668 [Mixia osmundae IAM 14324]|uniref:START domain-containing protein n=1 Tax=Mixia osmundae (strain CBS 9802 / IAM 14324 / JCM 22182 / KY 12970) TaxID=764103 RepID=G7E8V0_MIXOS|nr:uncharacterized protein L969DRAFT_73668 [Mixia osmundae IAM 14324]KEI40204.1 hypothetical protein L969DRAFT_73668 [Mixia osmundae IAM 14324]GAA99568.1 hypothetical protein E5Q_06269 [Mixia osmundae IAM 14324]